MSFCVNCGASLTDGDNFCTSCGFACSPATSTRTIAYDGALHKCPNCGEPIGSFDAICPSCKYEIRKDDVSLVNTLVEKLDRIDVSYAYNPKLAYKKKVEAIRYFATPSTKKELFEYMLFVSSNIDCMALNGGDKEQKSLAKVWLEKLEEGLKKAELLFPKSSDDYKYIYNIYKATTDNVSASRKKVGTRKIIKFISVLLILAMLISSFYFLVVSIKKHQENELYGKKIEWDTGGLFDIMPKANTNYGEILSSSESCLKVDFYKIKKTDLDSYVEKCQLKGFSNDVSQDDSLYKARDDAGYIITINYNSSTQTMRVELDASSLYIQTKLSATALKQKELSTVSSQFKEWGFENISFSVVYISDDSHVAGEIKQITINGIDNFRKNQYFPSNSLVEIVYYEFIKGDISVGVSNDYFEGKFYPDAVAYFKGKGFTNIKTNKLGDLITGWVTKDGEIESVSINGKTSFSSADKFPEDAEIVITYHTFD